LQLAEIIGFLVDFRGLEFEILFWTIKVDLMILVSSDIAARKRGFIVRSPSSCLVPVSSSRIRIRIAAEELELNLKSSTTKKRTVGLLVNCALRIWGPLLSYIPKYSRSQ